ncbi:putative inorganic phosphate cotransporter isoform X4 [Leptinotarsa decemlineata]|uniref:putative inorganic phosphate cotransporter isoform X4 n=1 Tax=Leptinotarsa decemlineata TaxID=7539 RepID=UPI003D3049D7
MDLICISNGYPMFTGGKVGKRHGQILLFAFLICFASATRVDMSISIVAMTDNRASANEDITTFNWTDKGLVLSSFLWGYMIPQTGAGWLANRYGPKWFLVAGMTTCSLLGLLLPTLAVTFGSYGVMVCRFFQGICQSCVYPSVQTLLGKWVPKNERSRLGSFVHAGGPVGMLTGTLLSGYIASSYYGWPMVFYVFYSTLLSWCILFAWVGTNSPKDHSTISRAERLYIEITLNQEKHTENASTPWADIFKSLPFWALLIHQAGFIWGHWTLLTETPIYLSSVLKFPLESNGQLSSLPYVAQWVLSIFFSFCSDWLINRKICSVGMTRKFMSMIGSGVPALALIFLAQCDEKDSTIAIISLVLAGGAASASFSGFLVNHLDLSPNHSGILMGLTNHAGIICSAQAPALMHYLVTDEEDPEQWKIIFYLASAVYITTTIIFIVFGSGEVQPWNEKEKGVSLKTDDN